MPSAYKTTQVPVSRSQESIRKLLINFGVRGIQFSEDFNERQVNVRFAKEIGGQMRTVSVTMVIPEAPKVVRKRAVRYVRGKMVYSKTDNERQEQMARATYRALHDWLKSQFVAVEFGLLTFEDVFLSHFEWVLNGYTTTVGALVKPRLNDRMLSAPMPENDDVVDAGE
jgi:hypothetical protein